MQPAPIKPTITIDVLDQIDARVGTIERVEEVKGSNFGLKFILLENVSKEKICVVNI